MFFLCLIHFIFLLVIWLPQGLLWVTVEEPASLARFQSLHYSCLLHWEPPNEDVSQSPAKHISRIQTGNLQIQRIMHHSTVCYLTVCYIDKYYIVTFLQKAPFSTKSKRYSTCLALMTMCTFGYNDTSIKKKTVKRHWFLIV